MQVPYPLFRTQRYRGSLFQTWSRSERGCRFTVSPAASSSAFRLIQLHFPRSFRADYDVRVTRAGNEPGEPDSSSTLSFCVLSDYNLPAYCGHVSKGHVTLLAVSGRVMSHCWPCQGGLCHTVGRVREDYVTLLVVSGRSCHTVGRVRDGHVTLLAV